MTDWEQNPNSELLVITRRNARRTHPGRIKVISRLDESVLGTQ